MPPTSPAADGPAVAGFRLAGLAFLREVAARQDKPWIDAHKAEYERDVRAPLGALVVAVAARCAAAGLPFRADPKRSLFRLHRDVRFSADKRPYKTAASAALTRTGEKQAPGVLYLHFDPAGSFVAAGFYRPDPDALHRMRTHLVERPAAWRRVARALADAGLALERDDALVRLPRGFEAAAAALGDALRLKSWVVRRPLTPAEVHDAGLAERVAAFAAAAAPLLRFGWAALDRRAPERPTA